jgi:hypothetical protein
MAKRLIDKYTVCYQVQMNPLAFESDDFAVTARLLELILNPLFHREG